MLACRIFCRSSSKKGSTLQNNQIIASWILCSSTSVMEPGAYGQTRYRDLFLTSSSWWAAGLIWPVSWVLEECAQCWPGKPTSVGDPPFLTNWACIGPGKSYRDNTQQCTLSVPWVVPPWTVHAGWPTKRPVESRATFLFLSLCDSMDYSHLHDWLALTIQDGTLSALEYLVCARARDVYVR